MAPKRSDFTDCLSVPFEENYKNRRLFMDGGFSYIIFNII